MFEIPAKFVVAICFAVALIFLGIGWKWCANVKNREIAEMKAAAAEQKAADATASLQQFETDAKVIHDAAQQAQLDLSGVKKQLDVIARRKNAPPLPADCHPDPVRVQNLTDSVEAVNAAIARH